MVMSFHKFCAPHLVGVAGFKPAYTCVQGKGVSRYPTHRKIFISQLGWLTRVELVATGATTRRSIQLNYSHSRGKNRWAVFVRAALKRSTRST